MTNLVPITPTRTRNVPKTVSISDKIIRFSLPISNHIGAKDKFVSVTYDKNLDRLYFLVDNEPSINKFKLHYTEVRKTHTFSSMDIINLFRSYIPTNIVTAKFPVTFVTNEYFYIEFTNWFDGTRNTFNRNGKVVIKDE